MVNSGTLRVSGGGSLNLQGNDNVPLDNTGGLISASGKATVRTEPDMPAFIYLSTVNIGGFSVSSGSMQAKGGQIALYHSSLENVAVNLVGGGVLALAGGSTLSGLAIRGDKASRVQFDGNAEFDGVNVLGGVQVTGANANIVLNDLSLLGGSSFTLDSSTALVSGSLTNTGLFRLGVPAIPDRTNPGMYLTPDTNGVMLISGQVEIGRAHV